MSQSTGSGSAAPTPRQWEVRAALRAMNRVGDTGGRSIAHDIVNAAWDLVLAGEVTDFTVKQVAERGERRAADVLPPLRQQGRTAPRHVRRSDRPGVQGLHRRERRLSTRRPPAPPGHGTIPVHLRRPRTTDQPLARRANASGSSRRFRTRWKPSWSRFAVQSSTPSSPSAMPMKPRAPIPKWRGRSWCTSSRR